MAYEMRISDWSSGVCSSDLRAHREDAYREFLRRYKAGVYRLIVRQIGDADEAMDLTQEAIVAGFSALDRYDGDRPFRTWIAHIALNKCHDWARRRKEIGRAHI